MKTQGTLKSNIGLDNFGMKNKIGVSSLKIMDGEDLTFGDRKRIQTLQQKEWIEQQMREKEAKKNNEKNQKELSDKQTLQINEMRKQLEEDHNKRRETMEKTTKDMNLQLMNEKFDRDRIEKEKNEQEKIDHLKYSVSNDFITENTQTCQSHFQKTRVIKYHWKGMNGEEKKDILRTIDQQREERERLAKLKADEEKAYALQTEHNRRILLNLEREKTKNLTQVKNNVKEYNLLLSKEQSYAHKHAYD